MNTKLRIMVIALLASFSTASAIFLSPFTSWDDLTQKSPDIVIVRCTATPMSYTAIDGMVFSEIEVLFVLKGSTKTGHAKMVSQYVPHQGEEFLMFSTYQSNQRYQAYNAAETHRIVPIDRYFDFIELANKSPVEQIKLVLRNRLESVRRDLEQLTEERKRLEQNFNK